MKTLRTLHRWFGLLIALPVAIQGLTGCVLAIEPWLPSPVTTQAGEPHPASAIAGAALAVVGPAARVMRYTPGEPGRPAQVQVSLAEEPPRSMLVDPVSLQVLGPAGEGWTTLRSLHVQFLAPAWGGRSIGGWFGVGLLLLLVSGIPLWWPKPGRWRAALTIDRHASGWSFHRRLHGAIGIWTAAVMLVLVGTGVVLAFPRTSRGLLGLPAAGPPQASRVQPRAAALAVDLDGVVAAGAATVPDAKIRTVMPPASPADTTRVFMTVAGGSGALSTVTLQLGPALQVVSLQDGRTQPAADRAYRWMHDLHEGEGLGAPWRMLVIIAGFALPVFSVTGPAMWWLRRRGRHRIDRARRARLGQVA